MSSPAKPPTPAMPMRKRISLVAAIIVLTLVPAIVMLAVTYLGTGTAQMAATWASIPAIVGIFAAVAAGRRMAIIVSIVMGFLAPLAIVAGLSPVSGAALMAILCMALGRMARFGLHKSTLLVPVMLAWPLIDPPVWSGQSTVDRTDNTYLLWMAVIFFVGAIIPALIVPFAMRKRPKAVPQQHTQREAIVYTVMITVLVTVSTYVVLDNPKDFGGAFLIAAILVLAPIGSTQTLRPTILRLLGTLLGSVLVILFVSKIESLTMVYVIGLVMISIALMSRLGAHGWLYYVFMVPATACLNATSLAQVDQLSTQRVVDNIVGGVLVLIASALAVGYSTWASRHGEATDADREADEFIASPQPA